MKAFTVGWNPKTDQTVVEFSDDFVSVDDVAKVDILNYSLEVLRLRKDMAMDELAKRHLTLKTKEVSQ